jgi:hypothetical protein
MVPALYNSLVNYFLKTFAHLKIQLLYYCSVGVFFQSGVDLDFCKNAYSASVEMIWSYGLSFLVCYYGDLY